MILKKAFDKSNRKNSSDWVYHSFFFSESLSGSHSLHYVQCGALELYGNNKLWAQVSQSYCPEGETDWETPVFLGSARKGGLSES